MNAEKTTEPTLIERPMEKDCWPLYRLQGLPTARFIDVVGKIIDGRYQLLNARTAAHTQ